MRDTTRNTTRVGLVLGMASLVLAGCEGCSGQVATQCSDVVVSFESPAEGASVDAPFNVSIKAELDGKAYDFESASLSIDDGTPIEVATTGSSATFSSVAAAPGLRTLKASIKKGACGPDAAEASNRIAAATRTVTVTTPCSPRVTGVTFPQDANGDGKLNSTELPTGTDLQVRVAGTCTTGTQVRVVKGTETVGVLTDIATGAAIVPVAVSADETLTLFAELVKNGAAVNTATGNPEALASIEVKRAAPTCANTTKLLNGPADDGNTSLAGFQLNASGTVGTGVTSATLAVSGGTPQPVTPTLNMVSAQFTLAATGDQTVPVTLVCADAAGNTTTVTANVRIDLQAPTVVFASPVGTDGGPALLTQSPTTFVITTDAENGVEKACATRISGTTRTGVGCFNVADGTAQLPVSFSLDGTYGIEVAVTDQVGNVGIGTTSVLVQLTGCGLGFTRPSTCPGFITASQVSAGNYSFQTQSKPTCVGQPVALSVRSKLADGGTSSPSDVGAATVGSTGLASIVASVSSGAYLYSATVTNVGDDAGTTTADCDVTIDLDGPSITSPTSAAGQTTTINASQDSSPGVPGAQRLLQFAARVPTDGHVDVCTSQAVDPVSGQTRAQGTCDSGFYLLATGVTSPTSGFTFPEGTYEIRILVVGGGTVASSPPVSLFVDVTRPCLRAASRRLPQDTNADSRLNIAELAGGSPQLEFELDPACKDTDTSTLAATPVVVREIVGGAPTGSFAPPTSVTFAGGRFLASLTQGVANEQDYTFFVQLSDRAGNVSAYSGAGDPATFAVRVDRVAPICSVVTPSSSQTLLGQAQVPSGQFGVTVETVSDVGTGGVAMTVSGFGDAQSASGTPAAPAYQASATFTVTGTHDWTVASTCTDQSGNATTATPRTLTIDLDAPTCTLTSPTSTSYGVNQIQTTMSVGGAEGRSVSCTANSAPLGSSFPVSGGVASSLLTYTNGTWTVACSVADLAGNNCTSSVSNVIVNSTACPLTLTNAVINSNGAWFNRANTTVGAGSSGTATVTANTSTCGAGRSVTLALAGGSTDGGVATYTQATDGAGNVSFSNVALSHGERWTVTIDNGAGVLTNQEFRVALLAPSVTNIAINGSVAPAVALSFVAASGNRNIGLGTAGYFADINGSAAGAQLDIGVTGVTNARVFDLDGTVRITFSGATLSSQAVTSSPQTFSFAALTLPHSSSGALAVILADAAGNEATAYSQMATIDVISPATPTVTQTLASARGATVTLQWSPTYDDGADSATGAHAGYDVRWTTLSVPTSTGIPDSATYFGPLVRQDSVVPWSATTTSTTLTLPPLNTYYIAVRALDEVGNYSDLTPPAPLQNMWNQVLLSAPVSGALFGQSVVAARLNNDTIDDVVVSAPQRPDGGAVYVYYGSASFSDQATCGAGCQELAPSDWRSGRFGSDLSSGGNLGDLASEGLPDLVVGQYWTATPFSGRVVIYFGASGAQLSTANSIEIRGESTIRIGYVARIIRDINGDGLDELAIAAPSYASSRGRLYIFKGRPHAAWAAARSATDPSTLVSYIPITAAEIVVDGPFPLLESTGNSFGQSRWGLISVGDINADGVVDVALPTSRSTINRYRIFSGAALAGASDAGAFDSTDAGILEYSQSAHTDTSFTSGLGASAVSTPLTGALAADLVVSYPGAPSRGWVYIYADPVAGPSSPSPTAAIAGPLTFGAQVSVGEINSSDTRKDLLIGQALATNNLCWVLYQQAGARPWDGADPESIGVTPQFWVSKFDGASIVGSSATTLGNSNAIGDIDGLNGSDLILSDYVAQQVRIWR